MRWMFALAVILLLPSAHGFGISPCLRKLTFDKGSFGQKTMQGASFFNRCGDLPLNFQEAVHEHITLVTVAHYRGGQVLEAASKGYVTEYMTDAPWLSRHGRRHDSRGIVFGTWWNDDPLRLTWGQRKDFSDGAISALKATMSDGPDLAGAGACRVPKGSHLGWLSHFDKLQHLHFMTPLDPKTSTAAERVETTTRLALGWMQFAYEVAKGTHPADTPLKQVAEFNASSGSMPSLEDVRLSNCVSDPDNVKIWTLFTQRDRTWGLDMRLAITPDIALGSMLHVMQDAFSPGHTCRVAKTIDGKTHSVISDVENYRQQVSSSHRDLDGQPDWLPLRLQKPDVRKYENDPVTVGAWLMDAVDRRLEWPEVERHLRQTIFLSEPNADAGPCIGGRAKTR